jgi:hypothetical protein
MWGWLPQYGQSIFVASTVVAAVFGGIGIAATFVSAIVGYQLTELSGQQAAVEIERARADAAQANRDAATAQFHTEQLRRRLVWRMLDASQEAKIADALHAYSSQQFSVAVYDHADDEAENLGREIQESLEAAGWKYQPIPVAVPQGTGLHLAWANSSGKLIESPMRAVERVFKEVGIPIDTFSSTDVYEGKGPLLFFLVAKKPVATMELESFSAN